MLLHQSGVAIITTSYWLMSICTGSNADILQRFSHILDDYYNSGLQYSNGLPSVSHCADKACMSANYFGDLVKKHTGESAISYIHQYIILKAKNYLSSGKTITDTAYDLGFTFPGHFSQTVKKERRNIVV